MVQENEGSELNGTGQLLAYAVIIIMSINRSSVRG
jgi:hypothetical protein